MENLQELEQKYKELGKQIEKLKQNESEKRCRKSDGEKYYYIDDFHNVNSSNEKGCFDDKARFKFRNYFKTRKKAEEALERMETHCMLQDTADELNAEEMKTIDWTNMNQSKYFLEFNFDYTRIDIDFNVYLKRANTVYCLSSNFKDVAIEKIGEERLIRYLKGE